MSSALTMGLVGLAWAAGLVFAYRLGRTGGLRDAVRQAADDLTATLDDTPRPRQVTPIREAELKSDSHWKRRFDQQRRADGEPPPKIIRHNYNPLPPGCTRPKPPPAPPAAARLHPDLRYRYV